MARGWESKSVEAQAEEALEQRSARPQQKIRKTGTPRSRELDTKREGIQLSRVRVARELETAHNPRYKELLIKTLADLDKRLNDLVE
jgi:hypothetical protein